jgi:hypothetical protein
MAAPEDDAGEGVGPTHDLADLMARTARRLREDHGDVGSTLQAITATAILVVPHAEECSAGRSEVEPRASTSDLPRDVDALQERRLRPGGVLARGHSGPRRARGSRRADRSRSPSPAGARDRALHGFRAVGLTLQPAHPGASTS